MARLISAKGQTSAGAIGSPQNGTKWVVKWAMVILHTSSTSGTRQAVLYVNRADVFVTSGGITAGPFLATTGSQTATSANISGTGDVVSSQNANTSVVYQQFPEIYAVDVIYSIVTLVSGDTYDYYVMVEEVPS
jgi:hypothetical protein